MSAWTILVFASILSVCLSITPSIIQLQCTDRIMSITLNTEADFSGVVYAGDPNRDCRMNGKGTKKLEMTLPLSQCGIFTSKSPDDPSKIVHRVRLYIQHHPMLQQQSDEKLIKECVAESAKRVDDASSDQVQVVAPGWMEVIRGGDVDGPRISKSVLVGETITVVVKSKVRDNEDAIVTKCYASDGTSAEPELLIDDNGCSIDGSVMPPFRKEIDGTDKNLLVHYSKFPAFKFPDRNRLYLSCQVVFCNNICETPRCSSSPRSVRQAFSPTDNWKQARVVNSADVVNSINVVNSNLESVNEPSALEEKSSDGKQCFPLKELMTAIGILAAILLIAILLAIFFWWNRRQRKRQQVDGSYTSASHYNPSSNYYYMDQYPDSQQYSANGNGRLPPRTERQYESHT